MGEVALLAVQQFQRALPLTIDYRACARLRTAFLPRDHAASLRLCSIQRQAGAAAPRHVLDLQVVAGIVEHAPDRVRIVRHLIGQRVELGPVGEIAGGSERSDVRVEFRGPGLVASASLDRVKVLDILEGRAWRASHLDPSDE